MAAIAAVAQEQIQCQQFNGPGTYTRKHQAALGEIDHIGGRADKRQTLRSDSV